MSDKGQVLVVDDESNITELVAMALRYEGFDVAVADSGRSALEAARSSPPQLMVLDVMMPDLDGFEVARQLSLSGHRIPILCLTATEFRLLRYLMLNPRRVLTRAQILDHVWDYDFGGDARVLETYVSYLRKKIDVVEPRLIHTVRGVGYAL